MESAQLLEMESYLENLLHERFKKEEIERMVDRFISGQTTQKLYRLGCYLTCLGAEMGRINEDTEQMLFMLLWVVIRSIQRLNI